MAYIDKNGALRNSKEDLDAFQAYCRERVKLMKNSAAFLREIERDYDGLFNEERLRHARFYRCE
jgi:hypothetical protein